MSPLGTKLTLTILRLKFKKEEKMSQCSVQLASMYQQKKKTASEAAKMLPKKGNISIPYFGGVPVDLVSAIGKEASSGTYDLLNLYCMRGTTHMSQELFKPEVAEHIKFRPFFMGPDERAFLAEGLEVGKKYIEYVPGAFSQIPGLMADVIGIDTIVIAVSAMDSHGYFSLGITGAYTQRVMRKARQIIIEVNKNIPRTFGDTLIHLSEVSALTECNQALQLSPSRPGTDLDNKIGSHIIDLIPDRSCVQFGIGGVPNVIATLLKQHKDLGVHTELLADGVVDLIECGAVSNRYKKINLHKSVFNVAMGTQKVYDFVNDNPSVECYGADYVNDPYVIAQNDSMISVNAFVEIDLSGQVNAEFMGGHQYSGPGGALDFVRGAVLSKGGKSFLASQSTAAHGKVSRIVPRLSSITTDPRGEIQYIVTEQGICNLQGKSTSERTKALIELAAPEFRESLFNEALKMKLIVK